MAAPSTLTTVDLAGPRDSCVPACTPLIAKWETWWDNTFTTTGLAPAMIEITDPVTYRQTIGAKSRNMLRKAAATGFTFKSFDRNDHIDAIYAINRSKPIRSGGPMRAGYLERPALVTTDSRHCSLSHSLDSVGMFLDGELQAYAHLVLLHELVVINTILAHADAQPAGVSNALIAAIVDRLSSPIRWLNYTTMAGPESLIRFKQSVGFREHDLDRRRQ